MSEYNRLYILEGSDGSGKSTLAKEILDQTKGHLLHCTWKKEFDIQEYFQNIYKAVEVLLDYQDVILDRWTVSDEVYANAYRGGSVYSADEFMESCMGLDTLKDKELTKLIYCSNDKIIENHNENKKIRYEMFDDISPAVKEYEKYMKRTKLDWIKYDFTVEGKDLKGFVEELVK